MIIVTGGAGLIGSAMVWRLNRAGRQDILVVDHLDRSEKWRNLAPLRFSDYLEKDQFLEIIAGSGRLPGSNQPIDAVIHLGACSSTTEQDATYLIKNNFDYSKQVACYALERGARFVYASSAATYGDGEQGFRDDLPLENLRPLNAYGYSKQLFDQWLQNNGLLDRAAGLKFFNVFGPNEYHKQDMRSVVLKAYQQVAATGGMTLFRSHRPEYADGEQLRDFVYVKDAVDMTLFLMERPDVNGLFNIGTGTARSWNDLARALFAAMELPPQISYIDMPDGIRERYQYHTCADTTTIRDAGYSGVCTTLEQAVADYVTGYLMPHRHLGDGEQAGLM